ncbi:DrmB family protein [Streptomyces sp. NPDC048111]|uniref:DrmB family protein n=1 Tax=Streptomyces sp. NPDC048111 TaxID=3365500 RepID=UPI003710EB06
MSYFRKVGSARPSHLMFTAGVGSLVDLPNFSVLVKGLDFWSHAGLADSVIEEPRLRAAVNRSLQLYGEHQITELRAAPWLEGGDNDPKGLAAQGVGVPVSPFPQWLRCTACDELAPIDTEAFTFVNNNPRAPHEAKFVHDCRTKGKKPLAVAARFTLVCTAGHLDEFPYLPFVHHGGECTHAPRPRLRMRDHGGNQAANVTLECLACGTPRNIRDAMGERGRRNLPACRGRHPHLGTFEREGCDQEAILMVAGASNQWFPITLSALALPPGNTERVAELVEERWPELKGITSTAVYDVLAATPAYGYLKEYDPGVIIDAVQARQRFLDSDPWDAVPAPAAVAADLLGPEWAVLAADQLPTPTDDFALEPVVVPAALDGLFSHVRQVQRLREARALTGFTRLDAPDPEAPEIATPVRLSRGAQQWVPASEVRGEGVFLRVSEDLMAEWEGRVAKSAAMDAHREAYRRFRTNRKSDRITGGFDDMHGWPGARYLALHTLSHLLIRTIALECGYNSASLAERIYAGDAEDPRTGILIYTAVPDSEGTLGGLVSLAEPEPLQRIVRRALNDASHCSSDPLCSERLPQHPADFLHGAACHVCLFVSETTCERGNRYLDRRFLVPLGDAGAEGDAEGLVLTPVELRP